ncbi:MAG: ABC transporter permease [Hyphomicrobiaceae bacterium]
MQIAFERRNSSSIGFQLMLPVLAIAASLVLCSGLIVLGGANPLTAYAIIAKTAFGGKFAITETLAKAAPMILTGLAAAIAFRARFWNIGAEGQLLLGAMAAAYVGASTALPSVTLIPLMIVLGAAAGTLGALLPAFLKSRFKVDDVVGTLMLNFIILYVMLALLSGPWKDSTTGWPDSPDILRAAEFPNLWRGTRLHLGVLVAIVAAGILWFVVRKTTLGFAIDAVGENPRAAHHAGYDVGRITMIAAALSGAAAGLAGVGEVGGIQFQVMGSISPGYGYTGLVVAMLARLNPLGVVPSAIFLAAVTAGADEMSRQTGVPVFLADVIQGVTLLAMLVALLFASHRLRIGRLGPVGA